MTQDTDIHIELSCSWTMDPDMALGSSLGQVGMLDLCGGTGHSDEKGCDTNLGLSCELC